MARTTKPQPKASKTGERTATVALKVELDRARAHWHRIQGLAGPMRGPIDEVVAMTGWPRTLGGVDVYVSVAARVPGMRQRDLEGAVESSRLRVIPAVRGCIYLVPREHVALVMSFAEEQFRSRTDRELAKVGVSQKEIADIGKAVCAVLAKQPSSTDAIRKALPKGTVRSLGEKGKKLGISSPLPAALRYLEFEGRVERTLEGGRLDSERYTWRIPAKNPITGAKLPSDRNERLARLARIFLTHAGPVTIDDFCCWTVFPQRDARAAFERAGAVPVAVSGYADDAFVLEEQVAELEGATEANDSVSMIAGEDNYLVLHGGPALVTAKEHHAREIPVWGSRRGAGTIGEEKHIMMRAILLGDRLAGFWELDPAKGEIVIGTFEKPTPKQARALDERANALTVLLKDELDNPRSFSLDTIEDVQERADRVRALAKPATSSRGTKTKRARA